MVKFLAQAATLMREEAGRRRYQVASSPTDRLDPSTIYRFEKGRWPEDADRVIDLYAADLNVEPIAIWQRALKLWADAEQDPGSGVLHPDPKPDPGSPGVVAGDVAPLIDTAASRKPRARRRRRSSGEDEPPRGA